MAVIMQPPAPEASLSDSNAVLRGLPGCGQGDKPALQPWRHRPYLSDGSPAEMFYSGPRPPRGTAGHFFDCIWERTYGMLSTMKIITRFLTVLIGLGLIGCASDKAAHQDGKLADDQMEQSQCRQNLKMIYTAVRAYQKVYQDTPAWLSNLVPVYLANTNILVCPAARRTNVRTYPGLEDPLITTSYTYDFCAREVPNTVWGGAPATMKDWKNRQRKLYGDAVPMIRCIHHDRVLNISYGGELFESSVTWESDARFIKLSRDKEPGPRQK